jgi:hypothetical protein
MANKVLNNAKVKKKDEYYTRISDIEQEIRHYKSQFKDKVVFCNCDDPYESNFFKYFAMNFNYLGLKKLIATSYGGSPIAFSQLSIFDEINKQKKLNNNSKAYKVIINEVKDVNSDGAIDLIDVEWLIKHKNNVLTELNGNGDFRSAECVELLKEADIVVTNPPFSLFREYIDQLVQYDKKFLVIGNKNAITYKDIFALIKNVKIWLGYRNINKDMWFIVPENVKYEKQINGEKLKHIMACWYTNLETTKRHEILTLYKKYTPEEYPVYCNYNAINVSKVVDIPFDWKGAMGVPITFLDKYNPEQFDIIALGVTGSIDFSNKRKMEILDKKGIPTGKFTVNAKGNLYRKYDPDYDKKSPAYKDVKTGELYSSIYARVIIKKRKGY